MDACGLIVEYNPFHNGHHYHIEQAKKASQASCIVVIMSGNFLQRGEPAIIDKFHRTRAALEGGADIVLELPYTYAVQNSDRFAAGAIKTLNEAGVSSICFGSESGHIGPFIQAYDVNNKYNDTFDKTLKQKLSEGISFPEAATNAYQAIGLTDGELDLSKPNNILGYSYVKAIKQFAPSIKPLTIQRKNNDYHDTTITGNIASATSIRKQLLQSDPLKNEVESAIPSETIQQLQAYKEKTTTWHDWEKYFPFLRYRVLTMKIDEIRQIQGVVEGLEFRIQHTANGATSLFNWIQKLKTKRYTWTRLQRIFAHLLTNTSKEEDYVKSPPPYIRILGMNKIGQSYIHQHKKALSIPIISSIATMKHPFLSIEERAAKAYYSIVPPKTQREMFKRELQPPIII